MSQRKMPHSVSAPLKTIHRVLCSEYLDLQKSMGREHQFVFIISHMRSGSTLLAHILNSNKEILGYGETQRCYKSDDDLKELILEQMRFWKRFQLKETYVLDKLVHDTLIVDSKLLSSSSIKKLFLIREPKGSLSSLQMASSDWTEKMSLDYYTSRLKTLESYVDSCNGEAVFLTHEQLVNKSESVLPSLTHWLGLKEDLVEEYKTHKLTGHWGPGDGSAKIKKGKIVKTESSRLEISDESLEKATIAYESCKKVFSQHCTQIENAAPSEDGKPANIATA